MTAANSATARQRIAAMIEGTRLTYRLFGQLTGRAERTVNSHMNKGVVPQSVADWAQRVREIRVDGRRVTIVVDLPTSDYARGSYVRPDVVKSIVGVRKGPELRSL